MSTKIKLFEAFAGIGSQYEALKNISQEMNWEIVPVGMIEWYIPAIIAYQAIHFPHRKIAQNFSNPSWIGGGFNWFKKSL